MLVRSPVTSHALPHVSRSRRQKKKESYLALRFAPVVFSAVVMLLTLGGALLCAFAALRQSGHVAGLPDVDSGGGEDYRSAHAEDPFNPVAVPVGHDAMEASHTHSAARQPEGQRLLSEL